MSRIVWTLQAVEDVEAIRDYIARDSPRYGKLVAERIVASVERLAEFPESGRVVPELQQESLREVLNGSYRIVYRLAGSDVQVLTVFHGFRLLRLPDDPSGS